MIVNLNFTKLLFNSKPTEPNLFSKYMFKTQCREKTKVVFIQTHNTRGTTVSNIIQRFGYKRKLNFALPNKKTGDLRYNYFGGIGSTLKKDYILPLTKEGTYDILCHHVIFNDFAFDDIFLNNVTYITIVRDPVPQFLSVLLRYNSSDAVFHVASTNITEHLRDPLRYENKNPCYSFTNNRQSLDLGLNPNGLHDEKTIEEYIYVLDSRFDLVMTAEYFDESLVMLKRHMCWDLEDILYMRENENNKTLYPHLSSNDLANLKMWQLADSLVYRHFLKKFLMRMKQEKHFAEEVTRFREILYGVNSFCDNDKSGHVIIQSSPWNREFTVSSVDCAFMVLSEEAFIAKLRQKPRS